METDDRYLGSMTFGVTTKNPRDIDSATLPDDSDDLLHDKDSFIVCKNVASQPRTGDILIFSLNEEGSLTRHSALYDDYFCVILEKQLIRFVFSRRN